MELAIYRTRKAYRYTANTAGQEVDFTAAAGLGVADAVIVSIVGASRTIALQAAGEGDAELFTVADGRQPVFELRVQKVTVSAGTSATIEVVALYRDRWTAAA